MKLIDIHAHVQFAAYAEDRDAVMERSRAEGVSMINVGTQQDTSQAAVDLAHQCPDIAWATIGLHPIHTSKSFHDPKELGAGENAKGFTSRGEVFDYDFYKKLGADPKVIAIGECGLDYYRLSENTKKLQQEVFAKHVALAKELNKPLMIHCRYAYDDLLAMLDRSVVGDCHFFAGDWPTAKKFLDLGFTLSFTGVITFARQYDDVVKNTPLDMILAETDAPYITPEPLRGKRNEPVNVKYVIAKIAELKGLPVEEVRNKVLENARRVFHI